MKCQGLLLKDRTPCDSPHWYYCVNCGKRVLIRPTNGIDPMITVAVGPRRTLSDSPRPAAKRRTWWPPKSEAAKAKVSQKMKLWHQKQRELKEAMRAESDRVMPVKNGFACIRVNEPNHELVLKVTEIAGDNAADNRTATAILSPAHLEAIAVHAGFRLVRNA